jgi:hypothetical protein
MPFSGNCQSFDSSTLKVLDDVGTVYGLFKEDLPFRPDHYTCLFVGQTADLKTRLFEHYNNPSIAGVTHFFAEASATEQLRQRGPYSASEKRQGLGVADGRLRQSPVLGTQADHQ